jgi:hypothetical protein
MTAASTRRAPRIAFALVYILVLTLGVALGVRIIVDGYSPVPFNDFWAQFPFIERGMRGEFGLADLWAQSNEHRILVARIQFLLDYRFFDGTNVFLFVSIATSCLLLAATFATAVWLDTRDWLLALGTLAVAGTSALPLAGVENLTWAFQVQFVQVFLFATVSILAVVVAARSAVALRQAIGSGVAAIAAIAATYSMANGLVTWVVVVLLGIVLRLERRLTAALAIVGIVTLATFLWRFEFSTDGSISHPVGLVHYVALYLGGALTPTPGSAAIVGAAGLVLLPLLWRLVWVDRLGRSVLVPFGAGVSAFVLLTAAQTATGRLEYGVSQALTSRYSIASFTFWLALFVGFFPAVRKRLRSVPLAVPSYLAAAAVVTLVLGYGNLPASSQLRHSVVGRQATVVAYRAGVEDASRSVPNVQVGPSVTSALRWMEREKLGPWSRGGMVDAMRVVGPSNRTERACLGELDSAESVRGGSRLGGWIATPAGEPSSRNLVVLEAGGHRTGLGFVGLHRPDVEQPGIADAEWRGFIAYVRGEPRAPLEVVLLADDGVSAVCRLRQAADG